MRTPWCVALSTRGRPDEARALIAALVSLPDPPRVIAVCEQVAAGEPRKIVTDQLGRGTTHLEIVRSGPIGASAGRNEAMRRLPTDIPWVFTPNDTTRPGEGFVDALQKALASAKDDTGAIVGSYLVGERPRRTPPGGAGYRLNGWQVWSAIEPATIWRRSAVSEVGGFDPSIGTGGPTIAQSGEGTDLLLRMAQAGWAIESWPGIRLLGREHKRVERTHTRRKDFYYGVGFGVVARRYFPFSDVAPSLAGPLVRAVQGVSGEGEELGWGEAFASSLGRVIGYGLPAIARRTPMPSRSW